MGAARSDVQVHTQVYEVASGGLHVVSESVNANVVADSDRVAKDIAKQLSALSAQEHWITRSQPKSLGARL